MSRRPFALVIGGSSGLGRELALKLSPSHNILVTGNDDPCSDLLPFYWLELDVSFPVAMRMDRLIEEAPLIDLLIYAADFYQNGLLQNLTDEELLNTSLVNVAAPAMLLQRVLKKQETLDGFITITSPSQWTPRPTEVPYCSGKAALGMMGKAMALTGNIGKTLVAAPDGMNTPPYRDSDGGKSDMLDPSWVADQVIEYYSGTYRYKFIKILRTPARVEITDLLR